MRLYLLIGFCCLFPFFAKGQQIIVNSNGEKIIMYPDGSWRSYEAQDSLLLKQSIQKSEPIQGQDYGNNPESGRNKAEEQNFLIRQAQVLKEIILEEDKKVQNDFRNATNAQFKANEMLQNGEANKELIPPDRLASLKQEYDNSVKELKEAKNKQSAIKKLSAEVVALNNNPENIKKKELDQLKSKYNLYLTNYEHDAVPFAANSKPYHSSNNKSSIPKQEMAATTVAVGVSSKETAKGPHESSSNHSSRESAKALLVRSL